MNSNVDVYEFQYLKHENCSNFCIVNIWHSTFVSIDDDDVCKTLDIVMGKICFGGDNLNIRKQMSWFYLMFGKFHSFGI